MDIETLKKAEKLQKEIELYENAEFIFKHVREAVVTVGSHYFRISPDTTELTDAVLPPVQELLARKRQELADL